MIITCSDRPRSDQPFTEIKQDNIRSSGTSHSMRKDLAHATKELPPDDLDVLVDTAIKTGSLSLPIGEPTQSRQYQARGAVNLLLTNRLQSLRRAFITLPARGDAWEFTIVIAIYCVGAITIGFWSGFFEFGLLRTETSKYLLLPFSMLFVPSITEETVFRALLLPHPTLPWGKRSTITACLLSVACYVAWHPFFAAISGLRINVFDVPFLAIVLLLGITCTWLYLRSGSIWLPIGIHWFSVMTWVFFLGGRNILLT